MEYALSAAFGSVGDVLTFWACMVLALIGLACTVISYIKDR